MFAIVSSDGRVALSVYIIDIFADGLLSNILLIVFNAFSAGIGVFSSVMGNENYK